MTSITLPDSITSIGYEAFVFCESLASVTTGVSLPSTGPLSEVVTAWRT